MKICTHFNSTGGFKEGARLLREMEGEGLDLVWVAEVYGYDSPSLMGFIAGQTERVEIGSAIMPLYSRTPALIAMTAAGIDAISGGRKCHRGNSSRRYGGRILSASPPKSRRAPPSCRAQLARADLGPDAAHSESARQAARTRCPYGSWKSPRIMR